MSLTREDLQSIERLIRSTTEDILRDHWEHVMIPWMNENFVSKKDLREEFELYTIKMEERIQPIEKEIIRVKENGFITQRSLREHRDYTEIKLESHSRAIREIRGVAEPKVMYRTKKDEDKP
ncbi:MAG: hypothetical protein HZA34_00415 [Candidatus Pacebacteria bacterium]|nr:hypothetical protein [Candidatus Paceibacterota bacterium]